MSFLLYHFNLDLLVFALAIGLATYGVGVWARRKVEARMGWKIWAGMSVIGVAAIALALVAENLEHRQLERTVSGLAPTYADEMYRLGHESMTPETSPEDARYLAMIEAQKRWLRDNPEVADIYTFMRTPEGKHVLVVDSETDYDRNGVFKGERETRTAIGEVYEEDEELLAKAFSGEPVFTPEPTSDRWGTWISTYVPMRNAQGQVIAVLGVDYDAKGWVSALLARRGSILALGGIVAIVLLASQTVLLTLRSEMKKREVLSQQLVDASRKAGMAEIATGVLHNVGNAINSINISAGVIIEKIRSGSATPAEISQVVEMINAHQGKLDHFFTQDETGKQVPAYFNALAEALEADHQTLSKEMNGLMRGIDHVKEIVRAQQEFSTHRPLKTSARPRDIFEDAISMNRISCERHGVEISREFADVPPMSVDRNQVMQILVNLLGNASHAAREHAENNGTKAKVVVRLREVTEHAGARAVEWQVEDNGIGISAENMAKMFRHGFTTKPDGHGFGLHMCANAASSMGGKMSVHSDGEGKGARFTLTIPFTPAELTPGTRITAKEAV